ncbi:MAG TPA: V-type ATP synthase subunit E [Clostridia bacterium]|nr:V-type ATP synthase subunit E [Clostridia bacterium]
MTGIDRIKSKILEDAVAQAAQAEEQAKAEAREIIRQASEAAEKKKAELLDKARSEGAGLKRRLISQAGLEGGKELLRTKQSLIDEAFQKALGKLCGLPDREYQKLLENMAVDAAGKEGGEIQLSEKDLKRLDSSFLDNVNKRLAVSVKGTQLTLSDRTINTAGGFILKSGDMEVNSTFEIVFGMLRTELEAEVAGILFDS